MRASELASDVRHWNVLTFEFFLLNILYAFFLKIRHRQSVMVIARPHSLLKNARYFRHIKWSQLTLRRTSLQLNLLLIYELFRYLHRQLRYLFHLVQRRICDLIPLNLHLVYHIKDLLLITLDYLIILL